MKINRSVGYGLLLLVILVSISATSFGQIGIGIAVRVGPPPLPIYAQPLFVRVLPALDTTGTFKMRKMDLVADGYDPTKVKGPLYFHDPKRGYVKVTKAVYDKIATGLVKV